MSQDCDYDMIYSTAITLVKQAGVVSIQKRYIVFVPIEKSTN